jgi:hypothetical protein
MEWHDTQGARVCYVTRVAFVAPERPPRQRGMFCTNINVGYQLYIQILAQYNSEVLHACRRERVCALTA